VAVAVAVGAGEVQVVVHDVADVVAVGNGGVAAGGGVPVAGIVVAAAVVGLGAASGSSRLERALVEVVTVLGMQVAVVDVVDVRAVDDGKVAAVDHVDVVVAGVGVAGRHA